MQRIMRDGVIRYPEKSCKPRDYASMLTVLLNERVGLLKVD